MYPGQTMVRGRSGDQTARFGRYHLTVKLRESFEEFSELFAGWRHVPSHTHFALAKFAGLVFMDLSFLVFDLAEFFRQSPGESFMQPAKKLSRADLAGRHGWQPGFHLRLNFHVREMLNLKRPLSRVRGEILSDRGVNISGSCAMPLDEVRVIAVHRTHQISHQFPRDGVQRSAEP